MIDQIYRAVSEFDAVNPVSGRKRRVVPKEMFWAELGQHGPSVAIKLDDSLWLVEREVFELCCIASGSA
jgi:hypothetical protein